MRLRFESREKIAPTRHGMKCKKLWRLRSFVWVGKWKETAMPANISYICICPNFISLWNSMQIISSSQPTKFSRLTKMNHNNEPSIIPTQRWIWNMKHQESAKILPIKNGRTKILPKEKGSYPNHKRGVHCILPQYTEYIFIQTGGSSLCVNLSSANYTYLRPNLIR